MAMIHIFLVLPAEAQRPDIQLGPTVDFCSSKINGPSHLDVEEGASVSFLAADGVRSS